MIRNSHNSFFKTPSFLEMPSFGLDISDESIKFIELVSTRNGIKVNKFGEKAVPPGVIESGKIIDSLKMEEILSSLRKEYGVKSVRVSLLENQIYLFKLRLKKEEIVHIRESIELSLEENIPIPAPEAVFDYEILKEDDVYIELQIAAIPYNVIDVYLSVFKNAGIAVKSFELEAQAIARAVIKHGDMETYMIVDFGEKSTGISIVSSGVVMFTSTSDIGGSVLNNMIQKNFKVSKEEAEKMKKEFGLQRNMPNQEIFAVLLNSVSILRDEVMKNFLYWNTHTDEDGNKNPLIKKIILCGGDSNLIGLVDYFSVSMKMEVSMADVWINIEDTKNNIPKIPFKRALSFSSAIGLALGDFEDN